MLARFRSWLQGFPLDVGLSIIKNIKLYPLVTLWSGILTIGFCGVYILVNLGIITPGKAAPPDCILEADHITHGQQVTCTGKHLDLVDTFRFVGSNSSYQVPFILHNESRSVLFVTNVIPSGEYHLEVTPRSGVPLTKSKTIKVVSQLMSPPAPLTSPLHNQKSSLIYADDRQNRLIFANMNWDSARLQTAIARFIIEHGYGHPTDTIPSGNMGGNVWDLWRGLLSGTIHVSMEIWLPNMQPEWDKALAEASVLSLGKSMDDVWQSAFVVPTYVITGDPSRGIAPRAPDLKTVGDLRKYKGVFATPLSGKKAVLVNCPSIWTCRKITEEQVKAYGLDAVIEIQRSSSASELFGSLMDAYEKGAPWLGYIFGPGSIPASDLDLTILREPIYSANCIKNESECGYSTSQVILAAHPRVPILVPDVYEFLRKWHFKANNLVVAKKYLVQVNGNFDQAAVMYLKNHEAVWTQWLPTEAVVKVKKALRDF